MMTVEEKQCTKCKQFKPKSQFKRRLSIAQSRAVLRNPNVKTNYMADSKLCKDCQPKRKPPRLLTDKEIRNRITDGDLRRGLGEAILEKRKAVLPLRRAKAMKEHWQKVKTEPIRQLKKHIGQQVAKYAKRVYSSAYLHTDTKERNKWLYAEARRVRDDLAERIDRGEQLDLDIKIETFFRPTPFIRERIKE